MHSQWSRKYFEVENVMLIYSFSVILSHHHFCLHILILCSFGHSYLCSFPQIPDLMQIGVIFFFLHQWMIALPLTSTYPCVFQHLNWTTMIFLALNSVVNVPCHTCGLNKTYSLSHTAYVLLWFPFKYAQFFFSCLVKIY